jgi:hypothetical protein
VSQYTTKYRPRDASELLSRDPYVWEEDVVAGWVRASDDLVIVTMKAGQVLDQYYDPVAMTRHEALLPKMFAGLAQRWRDDIRFTSSVSEITENPFYKAIIELGRDVVPLILRELELQPEHWFTALSEITNEDPIPAEDEGDMNAMSRAWIEWGRRGGLI